ncbi:MAG: maleylacetoacetate isomerase [Rhizobiales bacterium]|jgi:maleylacetoacetate isomerase|nr:maleylacetoacetate isomerase [Hyphomicrobiales bacterium]
MQLYSYFRSSASYRVRIALALKGLSYQTIGIHLVKGKHKEEPFISINPQTRVPALKTDNDEILIQSLAIIEWLDETHPQPPLLPTDPLMRARVREVAHIIAMDVHPLGNTGPRNYLLKQLNLDLETVDAWTRHWIEDGFSAVERMIDPAPYCFGAQPTLADICLVPQVFNARRYKVDMAKFPRIVAADAACQSNPAFAAAAPAAQPDAE